MTGETLDGGKKAPLVEARRAHASAIERVPLIAAGSRPAVVLAGRPAAERAADAGAGRIEALVESGVAVDYGGGGVVRSEAHADITSRPRLKGFFHQVRHIERGDAVLVGRWIQAVGDHLSLP